MQQKNMFLAIITKRIRNSFRNIKVGASLNLKITMFEV